MKEEIKAYIFAVFEEFYQSIQLPCRSHGSVESNMLLTDNFGTFRT